MTSLDPLHENPPPERHAPSSWLYFHTWLSFGLQSFGGGSATLTLIQHATVERYGWLEGAEFTRLWSLCQLAPGINLLAITILIGKRVAGWRGIALGVTGLLLPSFLITVLITMFYARVENLPLVHRALRGIIPATIGLGMLTAFRMGKPLLAESAREGRMSVLVSLAILAACAGGIAFHLAPVFVLLPMAGLLSAIYAWVNDAPSIVLEEL